MLKPTFGFLMSLAASACGTTYNDVAADKPTHKTHDMGPVQTWDKGPEYAGRKKVIYDTVKAAGRDDSLAATLQAMAMAETDLLLASQRDSSKDQSGLAKNYSLFNFNLDYLQQIGYEASKLDALNSDDAVAEATRVALKGVDKYGLEGFQNFHRGGSCGLADGQSYGCEDYRRSVSTVQQTILSTPGAFANTKRYGLYIQHV